MYIRRKVFSILTDEMGEERLYSVNETLFEGYEEREFAEKEEDSKKVRRKVRLRDVNSHRGLGRSYFFGGVGGALGGYASKSKAEELDETGATDEEIIRGATKRGRNIGAAAGAGLGALTGLIHGKGKAKAALGLGAAGLGAVGGALGGHLGAKKNVKTRLNKRGDMEDRIKD